MPDDFYQEITIWTATPSGYGGYTFALPVTVEGRWEDRNILFKSDEGNDEVSEAIAYLAIDVETEDYLMEGRTSEADPLNLTDNKRAYRVQRFDKTPDLRVLAFERKAYL